MDDSGLEAGPLDLSAWAACLAPLLNRRPSGIVIAVSGGSDSICMMQLTAQLARQAALPPIAVATVDHGLRSESKADADFVVRQAAAAGLPAHLLTWDGPRPAAASQEKARTARYGLLIGLCTQLGADHLVTAHTRDDQAETILFRLARGSGLTGLAGMRAASVIAPGVTQVRPLLATPKSRLIATCAAQQWPTVHDPSNDDPRFTRTRLRRLLPLLASEGLTGDVFVRVADRMRRAEEALSFATDQIAGPAVLAAGSDLWSIDLTLVASLPAEFTTRLIGRALRSCGPRRPMRLERLERAGALCRSAAASGASLKKTLHGCLLNLSVEGVLTVRPEGPRRRGLAQRSVVAEHPERRAGD